MGAHVPRTAKPRPADRHSPGLRGHLADLSRASLPGVSARRPSLRHPGYDPGSPTAPDRLEIPALRCAPAGMTAVGVDQRRASPGFSGMHRSLIHGPPAGPPPSLRHPGLDPGSPPLRSRPDTPALRCAPAGMTAWGDQRRARQDSPACTAALSNGPPAGRRHLSVIPDMTRDLPRSGYGPRSRLSAALRPG